MAEARALWEIALIYIALGAAARTITSTGSPQQIAAAGYLASQVLARAYWRLMRAVWTGFTIEGRDRGSGEMTSLLELYQDFETLAFASIPASKHADARQRMAQAAAGDDTALDGLVPDLADDAVPEDRFPLDDVIGDQIVDEDFEAGGNREEGWSEARDIIVEALEAARDEQAEMEEALRGMEGRLVELRKVERKREQDAAKKAKPGSSGRGRQETAASRRSKARAERAGATMKAAQSGARDTINTLANTDPRALGWVRVPHHPTPCGWCLMLASRGIILYKSAASARSAWHENCHCTAEPVFSRDHYFTSPQFAKNRALHVIWRRTGFGKGQQGERDFRNHFRQRYANGVNLHTILRENAQRQDAPPSQEDT